MSVFVHKVYENVKLQMKHSSYHFDILIITTSGIIIGQHIAKPKLFYYVTKSIVY